MQEIRSVIVSYLAIKTFGGAQALDACKACRVHRFGGPDVITLDDVSMPIPGASEVVVRVKAAGVGPWDAQIRAGHSAWAEPLPLTLGSDISGTITAAGPSVAGLAVGDAVFGATNPRFIGGYADYALADAALIARKPAELSDIDAASVPVAGVAAWQALFEEARLRRGQSVMILGAAGSVGSFAVQLAHHAGVRVIGTASSKMGDYVRGLGADEILDHWADGFASGAREVDAVIDLLGGKLQYAAFASLKSGGVLVSAVSAPDHAVARSYGVTGHFFIVSITRARLDAIGAMIAAGRVSTSIGAVLPLAAARIAHEMLDGRRTRPRGKIVLQVAA
jgi:NADPH:quinone reductase-like Zn-dependent oxidoreductase